MSDVVGQTTAARTHRRQARGVGDGDAGLGRLYERWCSCTLGPGGKTSTVVMPSAYAVLAVSRR
jgi:hypothetical protein